MKTSDFYYSLPEELIAQTPCEKRDGSRMLVLDRQTGKTQHKMFTDLSAFLKPGDCLVFNDSRVIPARLIGERENGGVAEILLLKPLGNDAWETLARPGRRLRPGAKVSFGGGLVTAEILSVGEGGIRQVRFSYEGDFDALLSRLGRTPLPPYIKKEIDDPERYQTVYSKNLGSAAAPTAGLHFTYETLEKLRGMGVCTAFLTLHVGIGTFRPVKEEDIEDHKMHSEVFSVSEECANMINSARAAGGRIISVGTTSCRVLESISSENGEIPAVSGSTDIFIYPGYRFKALDGLFTNFHLPESTLIMLVSAFAGREHVLAAYREAVERRYRFFSFGDCMLIL
jgi:S-adenosylmethionine:tRNA ribosyltransferase-isomerase